MTTLHTAKGEASRQRILEVALDLFVRKGYEPTTMREIAAAAECSLGLTYRYFDSKEALVLELYRRTAQIFRDQVRQFPPAPLAKQFEQAMLTKLALLAPYKEAYGALFGTAMNPKSTVAVLGEGTGDIREFVRGVYVELLGNATDALPERQAQEMATVLYAAHLALILFWLYDRTVDYRATCNLIAFAGEMLSMIRPVLRLPPVARALRKLAQTIGPMFGDTST